MNSHTQDQAYWNATSPETDFPTLKGDLHADIAIVGGGIVGITTARLLKDRGLKVVVLEGLRVGRQVTGKSTAKVSSQHGIRYQTLQRKFGQDGARLYAQAQESALEQIRRFIAEHDIDCDWEPQPAYLYTCDEKHVAALEAEAQVAQSLGLPASLTRQTDLPFDVLMAMRFDHQAQFHPTRYIAGLARTIAGEQSHVFENSRVIDYSPTRVATREGSVTARHVVMATHLPLGQIGMYYAQAQPFCEPVVAARIRRTVKGMYLNTEAPSHSLRTHISPEGETFAIAAGPSFKPGHTDDQRKSFQEIETWLQRHFEADAPVYRWVNMDYSAIDSAPFVGWSSGSGDRYLVATGFNAWGITNGTAAAAIIADLATGQDNPWLSMFDATRTKPLAGGPEFIKGNAQVAAHLVSGYLSRKPKSFDELAPGDAAILKIEGKRVAAFRDEQNQVHAVSAVCSHMGCIVGWNENDRTWDCPCHGSRFDLAGQVLHGPATCPLDGHITG